MEKRKRRSGFTLIELLVVVLIIGILASIAVPQYFKVVEKSKASEALAWVGALASAQETFLAKSGNYFTGGAITATTFDVSVPLTLKYFDVGTGGVGAGTGSPSWSVTLTRKSGGSNYYGTYAIVYDRGTSPPLTCTGTNCEDLLP